MAYFCRYIDAVLICRHRRAEQTGAPCNAVWRERTHRIEGVESRYPSTGKTSTFGAAMQGGIMKPNGGLFMPRVDGIVPGRMLIEHWDISA